MSEGRRDRESECVRREERDRSEDQRPGERTAVAGDEEREAAGVAECGCTLWEATCA